MTPSAEELVAERKALDLVTERMGTYPAEMERAQRKHDDLLDVLMPSRCWTLSSFQGEGCPREAAAWGGR